MKLKKPTDDDLNAAFAEHVCGWHRGKGNKQYKGYWYDTDKSLAYTSSNPPAFTASADAVLPWLDRVGMWKAERFLPSDICIKGQAYRVDVANRHACDFCHADDDSFSRAAVIALLRAYGVEVVLK